MPVAGQDVFNLLFLHHDHGDAIGEAVRFIEAGFVELKGLKKQFSLLRDNSKCRKEIQHFNKNGISCNQPTLLLFPQKSFCYAVKLFGGIEECNPICAVSKKVSHFFGAP